MVVQSLDLAYNYTYSAGIPTTTGQYYANGVNIIA